MKRLLIFFTVLIAIINFIFLYERDFGRGGFGPAALLAEIVLAGTFLFFLITVILYETRFREIMTRIWLVLLSVIVGFVLLETLASFVLVEPLSPPLVPDEYRHHKLIPNTQSYFEQRDFSYIQRVNNFGLRGKDITIKKPAKVFRILMLGDSFTMGKGVEDNETVPFIVEELLKSQRAKPQDTIEVLNGGVDSYAPILSYIQLTRDLKLLEPDMVILNLDVSDLVQEAVYRSIAVYTPDGEIIGVSGDNKNNSTFTDRLRDWTERNLYLTRLMFYYANKFFKYKEFTVRRIVEQANFELAMHTLAEDTADRQEQWQNLFDSILKIKEFCEANSMRFILTTYPWGHQVNEKENIPIKYQFMPKGATVSDKSLLKIIEFSSDNNIPLINLFPVFRSYSGQSLLYFKHDTHMTTAGYRLMANGIAQYLIENYWKD